MIPIFHVLDCLNIAKSMQSLLWLSQTRINDHDEHQHEVLISIMNLCCIN